jgi:hypothetical protein
MRATCPAHLILLDLICRMKFGGISTILFSSFEFLLFNLAFTSQWSMNSLWTTRIQLNQGRQCEDWLWKNTFSCVI